MSVTQNRQENSYAVNYQTKTENALPRNRQSRDIQDGDSELRGKFPKRNPEGIINIGSQLSDGVASVQSIDFANIANGATLDTTPTWYFTFHTPEGAYLVWVDVDSGGTDPALDGYTSIEVDVGAADSANSVAGDVRDAINGSAADTTAALSTDAVTLTSDNEGFTPSIEAQVIDGIDFLCSTTTLGKTAKSYDFNGVD